LVKRARTAIEGTGENVDSKVFDRFAKRLSYLHGDVTDAKLYKALKKQIGSAQHCLFYLEMPPSLFAPIVEQLAGAELLTGSRVAVEKPFGHDLTSALELNERLRAVLDEDQIFRVDHFLGKEPVVELEYLRFANLAVAELWSRKYISEIQITMAENFGVEDRGSFYDGVGALRDVVQNHLLQVLAGVAMEPPVGPSADDLNDKKADVLRAIPAVDPERSVRGQYVGYTDIDGVAKDSDTETFVAMRVEIDNWRWAGVPIFLRAGKALAERVTEVRLFTHHVPSLAFLVDSQRAPSFKQAPSNQIVLRIDPDPGLRMQLSAINGDRWRDLHLDSSFMQDLGRPLLPYERLLHGALTGDHQLFAREDGIEETWRIVQPLLDHPGELHSYEPGCWGPDAARELLRGHRGWQQPWLASNH
jgi:glucose-6-phosphate 1-dehydrogenase